MNASPLFIQCKLCTGGITRAQNIAHLDILQIIALIETTHIAEHEAEPPRSVPALELVLMGGVVLKCWDEERTGVKEIDELKTKFIQQAMNPQGIVVPQPTVPPIRHRR